jgi:predicted N-acetyltransferase YhbS
MMEHRLIGQDSQEEVAQLFTSVFTASEGEKEGRLIGTLASDLAAEIDHQDIICFGTYEAQLILGSIFFTRLQFDESVKVYMLAPVAVRTDYQGQGIGKALIKFGLTELKNRSVDVVVTYGDPSFYTKLGFCSLSEDIIQAPLQLSMPEGWLGQSLTGEPIPTMKERPTCVGPFNDPAYW